MKMFYQISQSKVFTIVKTYSRSIIVEAASEAEAMELVEDCEMFEDDLQHPAIKDVYDWEIEELHDSARSMYADCLAEAHDLDDLLYPPQPPETTLFEDDAKNLEIVKD